MNAQQALLQAVFVPLVGALFLPVLGRLSTRYRNIFALGFIVSALVSSFKLLAPALAGTPVVISRHLFLGINFVLRADTLAVYMACVSSCISAVIMVYSFGYISHYDNQNEYYTMVVLFLGAMMGLVFSANLILLYIFWEITAVTSWRLIGFFREREYVIKADKSFLVTVFGSLLMLLGFVMLYQQAGTFDLSVIAEALRNKPLSGIAVLLILAGIFSKSATLPFHTWLPDAGVAPSPVTALLHAAILVKIGVYVFARLFLVTFPISIGMHTVVLVVAGLSTLVSAGAALLETNLKRLIAYSTISQIGFIFLGLAAGSELAAIGGLLYILMHGISKAGLFLCAGIIEQNTLTKDITKMGGLFATMPITAVSFLLCAFSVMGIPPFGGFFSKYLVFSGALSAGRLWTSMVFMVGAFLTILYLFRVYNLVFMGEAKAKPAREGSPLMVGSVAFLGILSLLSGIFVYYPSRYVIAIVSNIPGILK